VPHIFIYWNIIENYFHEVVGLQSCPLPSEKRIQASNREDAGSIRPFRSAII
jgi:hypothetical protein